MTNDSEAVPTGMFFRYNTALGPPFRVLIDTNFINFSIKNKVHPHPRSRAPHLNPPTLPCAISILHL
jgi:hypothetical protein